mmetsp:Transcript_46138/g.93037  ORF Transcript_46138/g.93037 Transcript_46138/m.93037 type:complete len:200 (+) Transcript_46138:94-693(+)
MSGGFLGHGRVVVASCFHKKIDEMRALVDGRGHAMCVSYVPDDDLMFAFEYGAFIERFAQNARDVLVITGDDGELGNCQQKEIEFMSKKNIAFQKMTLAEYADEKVGKWVVAWHARSEGVKSEAFERKGDAQRFYDSINLCACALYSAGGKFTRATACSQNSKTNSWTLGNSTSQAFKSSLGSKQVIRTPTQVFHLLRS